MNVVGGPLEFLRVARDEGHAGPLTYELAGEPGVGSKLQTGASGRRAP
jgi:hypothetical protein